MGLRPGFQVACGILTGIGRVQIFDDVLNGLFVILIGYHRSFTRTAW
jgi:hypothetical protein